MSDNNKLTIHVGSDKKAVIPCPHCKHQNTVQTDSLNGHKHEVEVRCVCQNVFIVNLEFRQHPRKKTSLRGTFNNPQKDYAGSFAIFNLSVSGVGFTCQDADKLQEGDRLSIKFNLNGQQTQISKDVIVRYVRQQSVGCEFIEKENPFDSPLGMYVMAE